MGEQIKSSLFLTSAFICLQFIILFQHEEKAVKTYIIQITIIRFPRYHLQLASNSAFMANSLFLSTI